jgi:uncharacterized membrane protein HdeD (DUF308 family)
MEESPMATEMKNVFSQLLSDIWWLVLLRGVAAILLGILLFANPGAALMAFMIYIGAYWLVDGIFALFAAIKGRKHVRDWGWGIFTGIISILAGLAVFSQPAMSALLSSTFLIYLVGFMVIISGVLSIITGIRLRKEIDNEWSMILGGVLSLLFGLLLLSQPLMSTFVLLSVIGVFAIVGGILLTVFAFRVRKLAKSGDPVPVK